MHKFFGLAGYYRRFIKSNAGIAQLLSDLTRKNAFLWGTLQHRALNELKHALVSTPVLRHPESNQHFVVSTDVRKFVGSATLDHEDHPVEYLSHRLLYAETRWYTGDQVLLEFMIAIKQWNVYLRCRKFSFRTYHEPIRYLQTKDNLNTMKQRWLDTLQSYSYETQYVSGKYNVAPDAFNRRPDCQPQIKPIDLTQEYNLSDKIQNAYSYDEYARDILSALRDPDEPLTDKVYRLLTNFNALDK